MKYDVVLSLGYNCEVSFRIEDYFGELYATPFTWSFVTDRGRFVEALNHVDDIFSHGYSVQKDNMFMCEKYGLKFHPRYSLFPHRGTYTTEQEERAAEELESRISHLKSKFLELRESNKKILFIIKVDDFGDGENARYISNVYSALLNYFDSERFVLAAIMIKGKVGEEVWRIQSNGIRIFEVKKFASQRFTDIGGDVIGWHKIFRTLCVEIKGFGFWKSLYRRRLKRGVAFVKNKVTRFHI